MNNDASLKLYDKIFTFEKTKQFNLTIEISFEGIVCVVYSPQHNKFIGLEKINDNIFFDSPLVGKQLYEILVSYDIFKNPFNKISFLINTFDNIFIPSSLFDEKYKNYYCQYYHPIESSFIEICADSLLSLNMVNLYYLNKNLKEVINKMFNKADIFHSSTTLITGLFSMFKNNINEYTAFINLGVNYFNLIVIGQEGLIFFNSFKYKNPDDVLYHTLFVFEQFKLKQQTTPLYLAGEIDTNSEFYELLYKYIGKLHLLERNKEFDYSYVLDTVKEHLYFSAFNKELCA